jgi:hypothetical protein
MEKFGGSINNMSMESMQEDYLIDAQEKFFEEQKKRYQPNAENFLAESGFDPEEIKKEIALSEKLKTQWEESGSDFEKRNKKISNIFEGIIIDQFCGEWMANKAEAFPTADADDFLRKVDCVIEFAPDENNENPEYLGLGIDVTFSTDYATLKNKLDSIWSNDIEQSKQSTVKYVDTEHFKGSMNVFRTILATNKETVIELAKLHKNKKREELDNHPYLANALSQIKAQLETYYLYARASGQGAGYLKSLANTLGTFYHVYEAKEEFIKQHQQEVEQSETYKLIKSHCDSKLKSVS